MKTTLFSFFACLVIAIPSLGQDSLFSINSASLDTLDWENRFHWSTDRVAELSPLSDPAAPDAGDTRVFVIRTGHRMKLVDSLLSGGASFVPYNSTIIVEEGAELDIYTGSDKSQPFIYNGDFFEVSGTLVTSSDLSLQETKPNGNGTMAFRTFAVVDVGDDIQLYQNANLIVDNGCGDGIVGDDIYFVGLNVSICGETRRLFVPDELRAWSDSHIDDAARVAGTELNPTDALNFIIANNACAGFQFFNDLATCTFPVEWLDVSAKVEDGTVSISWSTASELNNDFFAVERSNDALNFEEIGWLQGSGNSQEPKSYRFLDQDLQAGISYYRIKQVDFDGQESFSPVVEVFSKDFNRQILVAQGSGQQSQTISWKGFQPYESFPISVVSIEGKEIISRLAQADSQGRGELKEHLSLAKGVYFLVAYAPQGKLVKKFIQN